MQTITKEGVSLYTFADEVVLEVTADTIVTPEFVLAGCYSDNSEIHRGVTPPADWAVAKYCFDGTNWTPNPLWVDPNAEKRKEQEALRQAAYASESDPIFFMAQRGEATVEEWTAKVAEIKARYPYPTEEV